jgi:hypothetical protein
MAKKIIPPTNLAVPEQTLNILTAEMANPESIRPTYSNNAAVMISPHEFRILFSEIVSNSISGQPTLELRANIAISPTQFKALAAAVTQTLETFEKQFGEIAWPPKSK